MILYRFLFILMIFFSQKISSKSIADTYYEALMLSQKQFYENRVESAAWTRDFIKFNNKHKLDEKNQCYKRNGGEFLMVLEVDLNGVVMDVFSSHDHEKSRCSEKNYKGVVLPKPPFFPAYKLLRFL